MSFTLRFVLALTAALVAAVILSPFVALAAAAAGFHFPFPRIFDRTVMVTLVTAILWFTPKARLRGLMRSGFEHSVSNLGRAFSGFAVAFLAIASLFTLAAELGTAEAWTVRSLAAHASRYIPAAIAIALIEEGFFRAFLLGGMTEDLGTKGALAVSSAIYALAHLMRSPVHFRLVGFHPMAGLANLSGSTSQLGHPLTALPTFLGLFLLGLLLGEAFVATGTVYFSVGLHAGFVLGAKSWPIVARPPAALPRWLAGYGRLPLISGAAGWVVAALLLVLVPPMLGKRARS